MLLLLDCVLADTRSSSVVVNAIGLLQMLYWNNNAVCAMLQLPAAYLELVNCELFN